MEPPQPTTQSNVTQGLHWTHFLTTKGDSSDSESISRSLQYCYTQRFNKVSTALGFYISPKCLPNLAASPYTFSLSTPYHAHTHVSPIPVPFSPSPTHSHSTWENLVYLILLPRETHASLYSPPLYLTCLDLCIVA